MTDTTHAAPPRDDAEAGASFAGAPPDGVDPRAAALARKIAALEAVEIETPEGRAFVEAIGRRVFSETWGKPQRGSLHVLWGPHGAGTTTIRKRAVKILPSAKPQSLVRPLPMVAVDAPKRKAQTIGAALVAELDPFHRRQTRSQRREGEDDWARAKMLADELQLRWLMVDRAHNIARQTRRDEEREVADWLESLIVDSNLALNIVLCGDETLMEFVERSPGLRALQTNYPIGAIRADDLTELKRFVGGFEAKLEFAHSSDLTNPKLLALIHAATDGLRGKIKQLLVGAALIAYCDDADALVIEHLAKAYEPMLTPASSFNPFRRRANPGGDEPQPPGSAGATWRR